MAFTERSQSARESILTAARRCFTRDGYERTTVRAVAANAGVDPSMVMRYYRNKEGLFDAAVDVNLHLPDLRDVPLDQVARALASHFVRRWEGDLSDEAIMILLRSAATNPTAAERMRTVFSTQVVDLVRAATHDAPDSAVRAGMISTQLLGVALTRYILRLPPIADLEPQDLVTTLTPLLNQILRG